MVRLLVLFLAVTFAALAQRPPVILVDGYHIFCKSDDLQVSHTFGALDQRLEAEGVRVVFFATCAYPGKPSIEELGNQLGATIRSLNVPQVDVVTHSMGGLIVRSYLAGKQSIAGVFTPPADPRIRKWISIATPNFGALLPSIVSDFLPDIQAREITPASQFLFDLATWNQNHDDLRGIDAIGIIGNAAGFGPFKGASDGLVSVTSASMSFVLADERTRVLPYCHGESEFTSILGFGCDAPPIAKIQSDNPLSWQIIDSYLSGTSDWLSIGHSPSQDKLLSQYGGVLSQPRNNMGQPTGAISDQNFVQGAVTGAYAVLISKPGPEIALVAPSAARLPFLSLAPRMLISIYGNNLAGSTVAVNNQVLALNYTGDHQVNALLPDNITGLAKLTVTNAQGSATVNVLIEDAAPAIFTMNGSGAGAAAAIRVGNFEELFLTGLGIGAHRTPVVTVNGVQANVTYAGPAPGYAGLDQINIELPPGITSGPVVVRAGRHTSNTATI